MVARKKPRDSRVLSDLFDEMEEVKENVIFLRDVINTMRSFISESLISIGKNQQDLHHRLEYIKTYVSPISYEEVISQECAQDHGIKMPKKKTKR